MNQPTMNPIQRVIFDALNASIKIRSDGHVHDWRGTDWLSQKIFCDLCDAGHFPPQLPVTQRVYQYRAESLGIPAWQDCTKPQFDDINAAVHRLSLSRLACPYETRIIHIEQQS